MSSVETQKVKNASETFVFKIKGEERKLDQAATLATSDDKHFMISYSWGADLNNRKLAWKIESVLTDRGFRVWRDENSNAIKGYILDAMADAINSSSVILILVSKDYKESVNCKVELTFALKRKKKVILNSAEPGYEFDVGNWLGVALGGLLYYDASNRANVVSQMGTMIEKKLDGTGKNGKPTTPIAARRERIAAPNNEAEALAWLKADDLNVVVDVLVHEKITNATCLKGPNDMPVKEMNEFLKISGGEAIELKAALANVF